jgi:hypothetical protein
MVWPPGVSVIRPRIGAWSDRQEPVAAVLVGEDPSGTTEIGIERRVVLVRRMVVAPGRVGLPDLHHGVGYRPSILVSDRARHDDALTKRRLARGHGQVDERWKPTGGEAWPCGFGDCVR